MADRELWRDRAAHLTTAHIADGCMRLGLPVRSGPAQLQALVAGDRLVGRACPARHAGSVDVFLEALSGAEPGQVLVVDNAGRLDESCVGDLVALEVHAAGLAGLVVWGLHRDSVDIRAAGVPTFSLGTTPVGPRRLEPRPPDALDVACVGDVRVTSEDLVFADDDGVLFVPMRDADAVVEAAARIRDTERRQADAIRSGVTLRDQIRFADFLDRRANDPAFTLRDHLKLVDGAIEE